MKARLRRPQGKDCDPEYETAIELLKVSTLRNLKRICFLRALVAAGVCFVLLFLTQLVRVV